MTSGVSRDAAPASSPNASSEPSPEPKRRISSVAWAIITAFLALASSVVALAFELFPSWKPDPREHLGAEASIFALDPNVTYDGYLRRSSFSHEQYQRRRAQAIEDAGGSEGALQLPGLVLYVRTTVEGFKRRKVKLRWSIYEARTRQPYRTSWDTALRSSQADATESRIGLDAPSDEAVETVWVPQPKRGNTYFVRVGIYDEHDVLLAVAQSGAFTSR